jgi:hypothetical protein
VSQGRLIELRLNVDIFIEEFGHKTHCALCSNPVVELNVNGNSLIFDYDLGNHNCETKICSSCNGSGEGTADGTCCGKCKGNGEVS